MIGGCCVNTLAYGGYSNEYCDVICHFFAYGPHNDDRALGPALIYVWTSILV